ncbi:MAG: hypothetical protein KJO69_06455 [Gammaproteobacteria bacterium]|nr:hypothetical protein [Gammaproteobacteria bacterium]
MAISINWATKVISVPQADLTFVGGSVYQLDTDWFRLQLKDLEDDVDGIIFPKTHNHNTQVLLGGISYARIIEIINGYTITFEDGSYVVNLVGSNNNILDVTNLNTVQLRSNNSAGLINVREIQQDIFGGMVHVDQTNGTPGTLYPIGTPLQPVDNFTDAKIIADIRGFDTLRVIGNATLDTGDDVSYFKVTGQNAIRTSLTINAGANTLGAHIIDVTLTGNLDGGSLLERSVVSNVNYINGFVFECMLAPGTITLGGVSAAFFLNCYSGVPGADTPIIDMNGVGGENTPMAMRGYSGGVTLIDKTGNAPCTIDLSSGQVKIDDTCVLGSLIVRGDGQVVDTSGNHLHTGTINTGLELYNQTTTGEHIHDMWQIMGLDESMVVTMSDDGTTTTKSVHDIVQYITDTSITRAP